MDENILGYNYSLLGFESYDKESKLGACELSKYISFTLSVYGKSWDNVVALVGDNCAVNKALAIVSEYDVQVIFTIMLLRTTSLQFPTN